jgi:hypothetical protein
MDWRHAALGILVTCGACGGDAPVTVSADGSPGLSCATTVEAYCASSGCVRRWQDVPRCAPGRDATRVCGAGHAYVHRGVDTAQADYYDAAGDLEAVVLSTLVTACVAGPATFVVPACADFVFVPACPDASP